MAEQYAALGEKDVSLCYLFASGAGGTRSFSSDVPRPLLQRELLLQEQVIATAADRPKASNKVTDPLWKTVGTRIGAERLAF
jgi:hypothetical protein